MDNSVEASSFLISFFSKSKSTFNPPLTCFHTDAESFRLTRQAEEEEGTLTMISGALKSYYDGAVSTVNGYVESIKGLKLDEKAK